jgi:hypothetical protein
MIDALACEPQFLDHLAPVWRLLASPYRGRFLVAPDLLPRARDKGIDAEPMDVRALQATPQKPPRRDGRLALIASIGDAKLGRRMGYGPFAFLEHGAGQTYGNSSRAHASYAGGPEREDHELVLVPNEYAAAKWRQSYPGAEVRIVGCPKLDDLPRKDPNPAKVVAISFHWPAPVTISGYAGNALGDYMAVLSDLSREFPGRVIGHSHPKGDWPERMTRIYKRAGIPFVGDFEDVCRVADVYVCDNSSTLFEFASTGRPVVVLNSKLWARARGKDPRPPGLRFWDAAHVGINVDRPEDLVGAIRTALDDPIGQKVARENALQMVYGLRTNGAQAAATAVTDWLAARMVVAA